MIVVATCRSYTLPPPSVLPICTNLNFLPPVTGKDGNEMQILASKYLFGYVTNIFSQSILPSQLHIKDFCVYKQPQFYCITMDKRLVSMHIICRLKYMSCHSVLCCQQC